jgi:hypothetical protein
LQQNRKSRQSRLHQCDAHRSALDHALGPALDRGLCAVHCGGDLTPGGTWTDLKRGNNAPIEGIERHGDLERVRLTPTAVTRPYPAVRRRSARGPRPPLHNVSPLTAILCPFPVWRKSVLQIHEKSARLNASLDVQGSSPHAVCISRCRSDVVTRSAQGVKPDEGVEA